LRSFFQSISEGTMRRRLGALERDRSRTRDASTDSAPLVKIGEAPAPR